jgi:hypothetical protein
VGASPDDSARFPGIWAADRSCCPNPAQGRTRESNDLSSLVIVKVTMLLADSAQVSEGKLFILGAGWSVTGPAPAPSAVALLIDVPWDETNVSHHWRLDLVDSDGNPLIIPTPEGEQPLVIEGQFEVGRPPGIARGSSIGMPLAINLGTTAYAGASVRMAPDCRPRERCGLASAVQHSTGPAVGRGVNAWQRPVSSSLRWRSRMWAPPVWTSFGWCAARTQKTPYSSTPCALTTNSRCRHEGSNSDRP